MTFATKTTISNDGTIIGYRQIGRGPGLIICHGAARISQSYQQLAIALSNEYTVYIPDRRGRGLSPHVGIDYNMNKASEDLIAVVKTTGADFIFGHSAGGLIALETMLLHPVKKLAVYEPPVSVNHSLPSAWLAALEKALEKQRRKKAMAISFKGLQVLDGINKMPLWTVLLLVNVLSLFEKKKEKGTRMLDLLPTLPADMRMAINLDSKYERYRSINIPVNLMIGSKSPSYFYTGIHALETTIKNSTLKKLEGLDHYSPEGKPVEIASELINFYAKDLPLPL